MTKMTNSVALSMAIEALKDNEQFVEVIGKLEKIKASIDKKNSTKSGEKKPTARQTENEALKSEILAFLDGDDVKATITDLIKGVPTLSQLSNQRVSAIVRQMVADNILDRTEIKRRAYFFIKK